MSTPSTSPIEKEDNKVFVGNLAYSTDKNALRTYFESAGKVIHATVIRQSKHRSAGYGFVTFETTDEAEKAAETLNKTELDGREISVQIARTRTTMKNITDEADTKPRQPRSLTMRRPTTASTTRIFVANLPYATTDDELVALFSDFTIDSASIARLRNGRSKGYGFVDVADETTQLKVINDFKPVIVGEREVSIKVAQVPLDPLNTNAAANQIKHEE